MEAKLALDLLKEIYVVMNEKVRVGEIVTDDDSTLRAYCRNVCNGGKLPDNIPQPVFLADPGHRVKVMVAPVFKLVKSNNNPNSV